MIPYNWDMLYWLFGVYGFSAITYIEGRMEVYARFGCDPVRGVPRCVW